MDGIDMLSEIDKCIAFQRKWRRIMSFSYFTSASFSIISAARAAVVAALGQAEIAAIIAAAATVFTSLEKFLLFRGRWLHHRIIEVELESMPLEYITHGLDDKAAVQKINEIMKFYATRMPMAADTRAA